MLSTYSLSNLSFGNEVTRRFGFASNIDPNGQDIELWWTAKMPTLAGYGNQPYGESDYGGSYPSEFLGFKVVVSMQCPSNTSNWTIVREARTFDTRFVYSEEDNVADAKRYSMGFQTIVQFQVAPISIFGIGSSLTVTTVAVDYIGYAGPPRACTPKYLLRPLRIKACDDSVSKLIVYNSTGVAVATVDALGKIYGTGIDGGSVEGTNFADPTSPQSVATKAYVDAHAGGAGATNLDGLTDVAITAPAAGQVLYYNGSTWLNSVFNIDDLNDVTITAVATNDILAYNGSAWVNTPFDISGTMQFFGDGSDGASSPSSGTTTLTRDMYYTTLTPSGTAKFVMAGFRIFCSVGLDISNAPADCFSASGPAGTSSGGTGGGGVGSTPTAASVGGGGGGPSAGGAGGTGAGAQSTAVSNVAVSNGGGSGASGSGGDGASGAGGAGRSGATITAALVIRRPVADLLRGATLILGGAGAAGGCGGGGDGTAGGGGGGGGCGGGIVAIFAKVVTRGASTAVGAISAKGGNGGNGGAPAAGNRGGGGGGGGAGGGWIFLVYGKLSGSSATNALDASGGNGGTGGNATGTGKGGIGGTGGSGGRITLVSVSTGAATDSFGSAGGAGGAAVGTTGGTAGTGNVLKSNL